MVEVTAVRVVESLGELADHLQPGVQRQVRVAGDEVVEALPVRAVPEDDRRAGQELVAVLLGADDPVVRDALQRQVLAVRGALHGLAVLVGRGPLGEEDADPSGVVGGQRRVGGEVVLPGRAGVEGLLAELVGADPADPVQPGDADLLHELRQLLGEGGRDAVALAGRRLVEEAGPDAVQAGAVLQLVAAVDALALELIQAALEVLRRQEDDRLDARERFLDVELPGRLLQLGLELLGLLVGEVQRVLDRPGLVAVAEQPGRAVVGRPCRGGT